MSLCTTVGGSSRFSIFGTSMVSDDAPSVELPLHPNQVDAIVRLNAAYAESSESDWDGEGSAAASGLSRLMAERFLRSLPGSVVPPEVWFNAVGDAVLEWRPAKARVALVSIGGAGQLRYAIKVPTARTKGADTFADSIPDRLLSPLVAALRL